MGAASRRDYRDLGILRNARQGKNGYPACTACKAGFGSRRKSRPRCHDIIDQKDLPTSHQPRAERVKGNRIKYVTKPVVTIPPLLTSGSPDTAQQIGNMGQTRPARHFGGQQGGLVVSAAEKARPMQWDRHNQHPGGEDRRGRAMQPGAGWSGQIHTVGMFELQDEITRPVLVERNCPPAAPGPRDAQAIVTMDRMPRILPRQRRTAKIADEAGDEGSLAPTAAAETEIRRHKGIAADALRRIDEVQRCLHSDHHAPMFRAMQMPPLMTDRRALTRNRNRATETFLHEEIRTEVEERLNEVNRSFTQTAVVTPFPALWNGLGRCIPDGDVLDLATATNDLVIHALCLHWANDLVGQLVQCRQALRPDGLFMGFLFGGQTLQELRACLAEAEVEVTGGLSPRILPMGEIRDLGALLQRAGFALPVADSFTKTVRYRDAVHLMHDLRAMGEGNALAARLRRPTRRDVMARAAALYQAQHADSEGRIPATFEIICLTGWAPHDSQQKPLRPGSAVSRLADALNTTETPLVRDDGRG